MCAHVNTTGANATIPYDPGENYYDDYVDSLRQVNNVQKHEVVDVIRDVTRLKDAWYFTLFLFFGIALIMAILILSQLITLKLRFPSLFCWQSHVLAKTNSQPDCAMSQVDPYLNPNVTAFELSLLRAFPSIYRALNLLTIFTYLPPAAGDFLQICIGMHGKFISNVMWRGAWMPSGAITESRNEALLSTFLPDPSAAQTPPWTPDKAPSKFIKGIVNIEWQNWLWSGLSSSQGQQNSNVGWANDTCGDNPFYDWFPSEKSKFFSVTSVRNYINLLGQAVFDSECRIYSLYAKGLVRFAIEELESSSDMSGADLYNIMFNPTTIIQQPPENCDHAQGNVAIPLGTAGMGATCGLAPFLGPLAPIALAGGITASWIYAQKAGADAKSVCERKKQFYDQPSVAPTTAACRTNIRGNCIYALDLPDPCSALLND